MKDIIPNIISWLKSLGLARIAALIGGLLTVVGVVSLLSTSVSKTDFALLYGELDAADAGKIVTKLESLAIPFELKENGKQVFVPKKDLDRLRIQMAEEGIPSGGSVGYEIFDKSDAFGTTSFVQDVNLLRALEGELARTIRSIRGIDGAKVHLVLPKKQLFSRETQQPSASIMVKIQGHTTPSKQHVAAIQHLVATAVHGLTPQHISIIDDKGNLLARGQEGDASATTSLEETRSAYETRLGRMVEGLLEKSIGIGKVRAEVTMEMDYDKSTENAEIYDPNGQVIRSTQTSEEGQNTQENQERENPVTVQNTSPNKPAQGAQNAHQHQANKTEETVNYEISKTVKTIVKESGQIRRLSIAVLVDGLYKKGTSGQTDYTPRSKEELSDLTRLVKSAIWFNSVRGDSVEVINMPFAQTEEAPALHPMEQLFSLEHNDIMHLIQIGILCLVALGLIVFVVRPLLRRGFFGTTHAAPLALATADRGSFLHAPERLNDAGGEAQPFAQARTSDFKGTLASSQNMMEREPVGTPSEGQQTMAEFAKKLVEQSPQSAANVIKQWMKQEG